ncbi:MAG: ankyrin repeat domain-containing protein [Armatimonadetes bacterium]|nr:ankyrin repeat domain-containing protein [Armatimonadota bacterium]
MAEIHDAVVQGNINKVKELIEVDGHMVNLPDDYGWTPLHYAAQECKANLIRELLGSGARVIVRNSDGETPMHLAVRFKEERAAADPEVSEVLDLLRRHAGPQCPKCGEPYFSTKRVRDESDDGETIDFCILFCSDCGHILRVR